MRQTDLVATLTEPPAGDGEALRALADGVRFLEVRADLLGDGLDPAWLRGRFGGELIYTLRSRAEGGRFEGGRKARQERLRAAVDAGYDLIDLEADRDCRPDLLVDVPAGKRLISWHGKAARLNRLQRRFAKLAATEARFYKLIPAARVAGDEVATLALLRSLRRDDTVCFAVGPIGTWTRLVAPRLGSPLVYGALGETPAAPGQLSIARLIADYGLPYLSDAERLYGIVGKPVLHSLSPRLHNGAYRALGIPALYLPFHVESFADFWLDVVESGSLENLGLPLRGLSVTAPHKGVALAVSGASSPRAQHIGAANTMVLSDRVWEAETTDPEGVVHTLERGGVEVAGRHAAVIGCGGAGKAAAYGLQLAGAEVTLVNRTESRGRTAALELQLPFVPLAELEAGRYDLLVNATALGHRADDPPPFAVADLRTEAVVVDLVYVPDAGGGGSTALMRAARSRGLRAFGGRTVLLYQALEQFRLMTGRTLNEPLARDLLGMEPAP